MFVNSGTGPKSLIEVQVEVAKGLEWETQHNFTTHIMLIKQCGQVFSIHIYKVIYLHLFIKCIKTIYVYIKHYFLFIYF